MKKEYWKPVVGYEEHYQVSNFGRVKSIKFGKEIILKQHIRGGYYSVVLSKNGIVKRYSVHRLVAQAFIDNSDNLPQINHKDEDKTNNNVDNLEWCDSEYNNNYGTRNKRVSEKMTNGKLSKPVLQYDLEGNLIREWASACECGRNGFDTGAVNACCNNKYKFEKYKNCFWKFKND